MPASYTSLGFILQATGENESAWGAFLNAGGLSLIDEAIRGRVAFTLSGSKTLTSTNGTTSEARKAILHITGGTGGTVTIPNYSKAYFVINEATGPVVITAGGAITATVSSGETTVVVSDGSNVRTLQIGGLGLKAYIDGLAFAATNLPGITPATSGQIISNNGSIGLWQDQYPSQLGNAKKFLTTDGAATSWGLAGYSGTVSKTTAYTVVPGDKESVIRLSGTFTVSFSPCATLDTNFAVTLINTGTGDITLDPSGSEMIDGLATFVMYSNEARLVYCDGSALRSVVIQPFAKTFTASGSFIKPPGYSHIGFRGWGSGGSGTKSTATPVRPGGAGGACWEGTIPSASFAVNETVTIGAGGAAITTNNTTSNPGQATTLGSLIAVPGADATIGGAIGGAVASPIYLQTATSAATPAATFYGGATPSNAGTAGTNSTYGGASGAGINAFDQVYTGGVSLFGGSGGASSVAASGTDGGAPGGGGGSTKNGAQSGAGGRGELRLWGAV